MKKILAAFLLVGGTAHAGGLGRPDGGSPTAAAMAGAFAAIADDASALYVNPAGLAFAGPSVLAAIEIVYAPRSYTPAAGGPAQTASAVAPAPTLGLTFKPGGEDSHATLGIGAWNSYGGALSWAKGDATTPAVNSSTELVFELGMGAGYAFDQHVAIGATLRAGFGVFGANTTAKPVDADLSASGLGIGAAAGILIRPNQKLSLGLGWRSDLNVSTSGSGTVKTGPSPSPADVSHTQHWPQSASLAVAYKPSTALVVSAQLDWTQWSTFESLDIHTTVMDQHFDLDWSDSYAARLGGAWTHGKLVLRGGVLFDGNAVPDRTIERQYLDGDKFGVAAGTSIKVGNRMWIDVAADAVAGTVRTVPDNSADFPAEWQARANVAPGDHSGQVFTLATGVRVSL